MSIETHLVSIRTYLEGIANTQQKLLQILERGPLIIYINADLDVREVAEQIKHALNEPDEVAPWPDYDRMTVGEIAIALENDNEAERAAVLAYERAHKNRKGVIDAVENWGDK